MTWVHSYSNTYCSSHLVLGAVCVASRCNVIVKELSLCIFVVIINSLCLSKWSRLSSVLQGELRRCNMHEFSRSRKLPCIGSKCPRTPTETIDELVKRQIILNILHGSMFLKWGLVNCILMPCHDISQHLTNFRTICYCLNCRKHR